MTSLWVETTIFLSKHGEEAVAAQKEPSRFEESLLLLVVASYDEIANRTIPFFSYTAHPSDDKPIIKDGINEKLEVSG